MTDEESECQIDAELGDLYVSVSGTDEDWVQETFEEKWQKRLNESAEMKEAIRQSDVSTQ